MAKRGIKVFGKGVSYKALIWALAAVIALAGAGAYVINALNAPAKTVGICMPMTDADRWTRDGENLKQYFESKGYKVLLEYADSESEKQIGQIDAMIEANCGALLIAATDCDALGEVLERAARKNVLVVAYDRLIMGTERVDYYVAFDNFEAGERQGLYIEERFGLKESGDAVTMEIFSGAPDDSTSIENYSGQMSVLMPYVLSGRIVVASGEVDYASNAIPKWSSDYANERMARLLAESYPDGPPDIILSANDSMALGAIRALEGYGCGEGGAPFPVVTGMDCDAPNVIAIIAGEQAMSLLCDTRALANKAVELVDDALFGKTPASLDTERFYNGVKAVPTSICKTLYVDADNFREVLVRGGYYMDEDLRPE